MTAQSDLLPENISLGSTSVAPGGPLSVSWLLANQGLENQDSPGSVVAVTSGGITINLLFDAAAMAAPASFRAGIQQAATMLGAAISDQITVNLKIDYSGTGGGAYAGPDNGLSVSYSSIRADLINNATPGDTTFNALPNGSSIQGQSFVVASNAELKLFGLLGPNSTTTDDGSATFATDINPNLLVGVALHELTHALGRVPSGPQPDIFDLFRFTSVGTRLFLNGNTAPAAYFSVDGGNTKLADYGQTSDSSDFLKTGVQGANDPFNEFYSTNTIQQLTPVDLEQLDALGFNLTSLASPPKVTESLVSDTGSSSSDKITSNPALTGSGDANAVVTLKEGSTTLGAATANGSGTWAFTPTGLSDGSHTIVASETNTAGNTGTTSVTFTLDTTSPVVAITSTGGLTNHAAQTVSGTVDVADAGTVVTLYDGTTALGTATVQSNGSWSDSITLTGNGTHTLTAQDTDAAANTGTSNAVVYTLNTLVTVMATYLLPAGDNFTRTIDNNVTVFAVAGANDTLTISAADTNVVLQGTYGGDSIKLTAGLASSFQVSQLGNYIVLTGNGETETIPLSTTGSSNITFSDGTTYVATYTGSSNTLTLGSQNVTSTPTAITGTGGGTTTIDISQQSLGTQATPVTITTPAGPWKLVDDANVVSHVTTTTAFNASDAIQLAHVQAGTLSFNFDTSAGNLGNYDVQYLGTNNSLNEIHIVGLAFNAANTAILSGHTTTV